MKGFNLPRYIAGYLKDKLELTSEQEQIVLYSLEVIIYSALAFLGTGVVGWFLGCLFPTLIIALTIFFLRCFSGGAHSNSPLGCILLSIILIPVSAKFVVVLISLLSKYSLVNITVICFFLSLIITWRLAPVDTPAKPVSSDSHRRQLKILSLLTVVLIFIIQCSVLYFYPLSRAAMVALALAAGLIWQTFSLTKAGHRFFAVVDNLKIGG